MTVLMEKEIDEDIEFDYETVIGQVIEQSIRSERCPYECEVNVTFTDNEGIRNINREFRELDVPTDVLSFPMLEYDAPGDFSIFGSEGFQAEYFNPETGELLLGDIVISLERAKEQAEEYGHSLKREICFLVAHSMLHLFGYDHMEEEERIRMEEKQEAILQTLGITRDM
ncbi:MAG: rRNA maturation RNase YbeY [Eubacteriales bacterium]|nr:rRNA maturation RNase YbeY [Eubacteriales bacterium]